VEAETYLVSDRSDLMAVRLGSMAAVFRVVFPAAIS
jgi:hypothetical protein